MLIKTWKKSKRSSNKKIVRVRNKIRRKLKKIRK